jgi:hypothetical protein
MANPRIDRFEHQFVSLRAIFESFIKKSDERMEMLGETHGRKSKPTNKTSRWKYEFRISWSYMKGQRILKLIQRTRSYGLSQRAY